MNDDGGLRELIGALAVIPVAAISIPSWITPFLAPSPWELPLVGTTVFGFCAGIVWGCWRWYHPVKPYVNSENRP